MTITILTPTFNRGSLLPRLYESLKNQTDLEFHWLVIDDGSTDDTVEILKKWKSENRVNMEYIHKKNGGKHTAINLAMKIINTDLTFIVDSDDWLPNDSIEIVKLYFDKFKNDKDICGISFWRCFPDGTPNGRVFPKDELKETFLDCRIKRHIDGDKAEVFYTKCLKKYPFPEFADEKYYPEDGIWMRMSEKYEMIHVNRCIYMGDYLEGGVTRSGRYMRIRKWPRGMVDRARVYIQSECDFLTKVKQVMLYITYGTFVHMSYSKLLSTSGAACLFIICSPLGYVNYLVWKIRYK